MLYINYISVKLAGEWVVVVEKSYFQLDVLKLSITEKTANNHSQEEIVH